MDSEVKKSLTDVGINVDEAVGRLLNNEGLYLRVLEKFLVDESYKRLNEGVAAGDATMTFEGAHALKGVASNLGMERLVETIYPVVETSRKGSMEGIPEEMPKVAACYDAIIDAVRKLY